MAFILKLKNWLQSHFCLTSLAFVLSRNKHKYCTQTVTRHFGPRTTLHRL